MFFVKWSCAGQVHCVSSDKKARWTSGLNKKPAALLMYLIQQQFDKQLMSCYTKCEKKDLFQFLMLKDSKSAKRVSILIISVWALNITVVQINTL